MADTKDLSALFEGLSITPSDEPLPPPVRGATSGPNPFTEPLKASVEHGKPYTFYLPADAIKRATFLINSAARRENLGVRIVVNVMKDKDGKPVKDAQGKVRYAVEKDGANKGKVLVRFQGKAERKQQTAPRPYSIIKDKNDPNLYHLRRRSDKATVMSGTHEQVKARYDVLKAEAVKAAQQDNKPAA